MQLYPYQENVLLSIESDPCHSQLISMPTGTGKTITFLSCIKNKNKKTLVLVHREELLNQTYEKAQAVGFLPTSISVINSLEKQPLNFLNIAMVQTLSRNLDKYDPDLIEMVVVDEAHHCKAKSYLDVLNHFEVFDKKKILLGFTATPLRGDKKELGDIFESHSFKMTLSEATQNGYICPVNGMRVDINSSLEGIAQKQGDYDISELEVIMNCESVNSLIADKCAHLGKIPGIVFCTSVNHSKEISRKLRERKRKAISVSYKTPPKTLKKIFQFLKEGRIEFVTNAVKLSEGFDFPPIQSIILARPTRSPVLYKQMIGRGLRKYENKLECIVFEFAGNDPKMICWEDIDENCTFQSYSARDIKTREEAIKFYKDLFQSKNTTIVDVRVSPFKFYECRLHRFIKYQEFYFSPFDTGFCIFHIKRTREKEKFNINFYTVYMWTCFWKEKYSSFYIWSEGDLADGKAGCALELAVQYTKKLAFDYQKGKWYPSEEDPLTVQQKTCLINPGKMNARKAEFYLEDCSIKNAIKTYFIDSYPDPMKMESTHNSKIMALKGKY